MVIVPDGYSLPQGAYHKMIQRNFIVHVCKVSRGRVRRYNRSGGMYYVEGFNHELVGMIRSNEDGVKFDMLPASGTWKEAETVQAAIIAICTIHRMRGGE